MAESAEDRTFLASAEFNGKRWRGVVHVRGVEISTGLHPSKEDAVAEAKAVLRKMIATASRR